MFTGKCCQILLEQISKFRKLKRCYKFGNGEVLLLINQVTLPYIPADVVQADMYSKASMKRAKTNLSSEDHIVFI